MVKSFDLITDLHCTFICWNRRQPATLRSRSTLTGPWATPRSSMLVLLATLAYVVFLLGPGAAFGQAKDTPFGVTFTTANAGQATFGDTLATIILAKEVGSTLMFVVRWEQDYIPAMVPNILIAKNASLKIMIQIEPHVAGVPSPPDNLAKTFTDPDTRARYLQDVAALASLRPEYFILANEVNFMSMFHNDEFEQFKQLYLDAYILIRQISPTTKTGVSYLDWYWFIEGQTDLPDELGPRDFISFTTYPYLAFETVSDIPTHWYTQFRLAYPDEIIIFSEVGWTSHTPSSEEEQAQFISLIPSMMDLVAPDRVIWSLLHEGPFFDISTINPLILDFITELGEDPEELFDGLNAIGLLTETGDPKLGWFSALQLDFDIVAPGPPRTTRRTR